MVNMLTHFVNIHAHSGIKHAMRNSRVTGTIVNKNEGNYPVFYFSLLLKRKDKNFVILEMLTKGNFLS